MSVPNETLKAMIRDYNGLELSDEELELVRPELETYFSELEKLESLDLSDAFSGRLMQFPMAMNLIRPTESRPNKELRLCRTLICCE